MDDLLKEAIADAKAVRETALENAKMALEEAFTPRLKSMLSQKIQNELEDEDGEEAMDDEEEAPEEGAYHEDDEDPSDEDSEMDIKNIMSSSYKNHTASFQAVTYISKVGISK